MLALPIRTFVVAAATLLAACDEVVPTTQIIVVIGAEEALTERVHALELVTQHERELVVLGERSLPVSFSLVPSLDQVEGTLQISARDAQGMELSARELVLPFTSRRTSSYGVYLSELCATDANVCDGIDDTCTGCGSCAPVRIELEQMEVLARASDAVAHWQSRLSCNPVTGDAGSL